MHHDKPNRPEDDYRAASTATADESFDDYRSRPAAKAATNRRLNRAKPVAIMLVIVVLLVGLGLSFSWFFLKEERATGNKEVEQTAQPADTQEEAPAITKETKHYASPGFMLEFDHPADWKVVETTGSGRLTATSPALRLRDATGQAFTGQVILTIRNKQQALPEFDKGNALAALESQKINYTKPSSVQRGSTYLSFLQYANSATASIDGVYITGDIGYQKGQAIPKADFVPVDPILSITFLKCTDNACSGEGTASGVEQALWQDAGFGVPLTAMLQSLVVN